MSSPTTEVWRSGDTVSIIITNHNYARFLPHSIESALDQSWPVAEIIIVDDGSTDESRQVLERYGSRIRCLFKANGGQASAFNAGFALSRGQIILFLDADDILLPEAVAEAIAAFADERVVKVHWPLEVIDADRKHLGRCIPGSKLSTGDLADLVREGGPGATVNAPTSGNAWRRSFLDRVMPVPEEVPYYRNCSDEYLYNLAPFFGHVEALGRPLAQYRVHGSNVYGGQPARRQLRMELDGYEGHCAALAATLARQNLTVDLQAWRRHSWHHRLAQACQELERMIPAGSQIALVDDNTWNGPELLPALRVRPFVERAGEYWGPPSDGMAAVAELERLRDDGVTYVAVAWPSFWWLTAYPELLQRLEESFWCSLRNDRLILFDLTQIPFPARASTPSLPRVSVIINNYNYGRFLAQAVESALQQTYPSVEVIVVDDGSDDDSRHVLTGYAERVRVVWKSNGGQASAYNAGFAACRGEIVCFLDADDTLAPETVGWAVAKLADPCLVKAQWPLEIVDAHGHRTNRLSTQRPAPEGNLRPQILRQGPLYDFLFTTGSALRRTVLQEILPMPEEAYRQGADVYVLTLAPIYGPLGTLEQPGGTYRRHGANHYHGSRLNRTRLHDYVNRFEANAAALAEHLRSQGERPDIEAWRRTNFNSLWPRRLLRACEDIARLIPAGTRYILINNAEWAAEDLVPERAAIPFLERDGEYWGPPASEGEAVEELIRLRNMGAEFVVFWWTSYWWLEHYPALREYLQANHRCLSADEALVVFHLTQTEMPRQRPSFITAS